MHIEERSVGGVTGLDLKGKITLGDGDQLLKDKVYTPVSRQGGSLKLLNLTTRITDLLSITKLLTVFETFESESEAVRSFSAAPV
jgi:anti-sigma B factor antagonist